MMVKVVLPRNITNEAKVVKGRKMSDGSTVLDLVRSIKVRPDEVLVVMGNAPVPLDRVLHDGDQVELLSIVSGG
jgi:sulfur carrier protein ThiS